MVFVLAGLAAVLPVRADQTKQGPPPPPPPAAAGGAVAVTVNYTGKGVVDATHEILVFLFANPNIGPDSNPLGAPQIVTKNGQTVTFQGVTTSPVYVVAVYDEASVYDGRSEPPTGTPIGFYAKDAKSPPTAVTPGAKTAIKLSFDGSRKFGK